MVKMMTIISLPCVKVCLTNSTCKPYSRKKSFYQYKYIKLCNYTLSYTEITVIEEAALVVVVVLRSALWSNK